MGATAISTVMRSDSMWRSIRSTSKRGCSRIHAPASRAVAMLSSPRMCEGGVMICMRSADERPSAARQCATAAANAPRVCRTALGIPVVPELNTNSASASGGAEVNSRRPGVIGSSRCSMGIRSASTELSPTACDGRVNAKACSTSARFHDELTSTTAACKAQMACMATTNSGRLDDMSATRSPGRTPRCSSVVAMPLTNASNSARVYSRSPNARMGPSTTGARPPAFA